MPINLPSDATGSTGSVIPRFWQLRQLGLLFSVDVQGLSQINIIRVLNCMMDETTRPQFDCGGWLQILVVNPTGIPSYVHSFHDLHDK